MTILLKIALAGLLMAAVQDEGVVVLKHDLSPRYTRIDYETACGSTVFRVRFGSGPVLRGQVNHVMIEGKDVPGAAAMLQLRAARRFIDRIGIMNCGMDERRPVFRGVMELSKAESQAAGMRASHYFRLVREDRKGWRIVFDSPLPQDSLSVVPPHPELVEDRPRKR
jgi:hypothetical protein